MANCESASGFLLLLVEASVAVDPYQSRQQPIWPSSADVGCASMWCGPSRPSRHRLAMASFTAFGFYGRGRFSAAFRVYEHVAWKLIWRTRPVGLRCYSDTKRG